MLTKILTYHVVSGHYSTNDLAKMIKDGHGKAELTTVSGGKLWAMEKIGQDLELQATRRAAWPRSRFRTCFNRTA